MATMELSILKPDAHPCHHLSQDISRKQIYYWHGGICMDMYGCKQYINNCTNLERSKTYHILLWTRGTLTKVCLHNHDDPSYMCPFTRFHEYIPSFHIIQGPSGSPPIKDIKGKSLNCGWAISFLIPSKSKQFLSNLTAPSRSRCLGQKCWSSHANGCWHDVNEVVSITESYKNTNFICSINFRLQFNPHPQLPYLTILQSHLRPMDFSTARWSATQSKISTNFPPGNS